MIEPACLKIKYLIREKIPKINDLCQTLLGLRSS
jgi:hypothetical protein